MGQLTVQSFGYYRRQLLETAPRARLMVAG
jgi:hypothetical protein